MPGTTQGLLRAEPFLLDEYMFGAGSTFLVRFALICRRRVWCCSALPACALNKQRGLLATSLADFVSSHLLFALRFPLGGPRWQSVPASAFR